MKTITWVPNKKHESITLSGFSSYESWGCWTDGKKASITFDKNFITSNQIQDLRLVFSPYINSNHDELNITIVTSWGISKQINTSIELSPTLYDICLKINNTDKYQVEFLIDNPISPKSIGLSSDERHLGIGLKEVIFLPFGNSIEYKTSDLYELEKKFLNQKQVQDYRNCLLGSKAILADALSDLIIKNTDNIDDKLILDMFTLSCNLKDFPDEVVNRFKSALEIILSTNKLNLIKSCCNNSEKNKRDKLVIIGGFFHSGSSAVYDFLRCSNKVVTLADFDVELHLTIHFWNLLNSYSRKSYVTFFLKRLVGMFIPNSIGDRDQKSVMHSFIDRSIQGISRIDIYDYSSSVLNFITNISKSKYEDYGILYSNFLKENSGLTDFNNGNTLLLNQAPTAMHLRSLEVYDKSLSFIAVTRDPRDQYIDLVDHGVIQSGHFANVQEFIKKFANDRKDFYENKNYLEGYDIKEVSFEDFITNSELRKNIANDLGLILPEILTYFKPEVSLKNIGIYKKVTDINLLNDIKLIENSLTNYLWPN